ncbi:MAG: NAD-dependent epimerase/dehydratase family protein [Anaerolineales bacterium]
MILVTGGGGFLGKALVKALRERGEAVRSFSRGDYPELRALGVETLRGDLSDSEAVAQAVAGCEAVLHVGAKAGQWGRYESYHAVNVRGTENVLQACRAQGVPRLVYTSSPSVIDAGSPIEGGDESLPYPTQHVSPYSETKAIAEKAVLQANDATLSTAAIRPPIIWGPGDTQFLPRIVARARRGYFPRVGSGDARNDVTYIDHAVAAHLLALDGLTPDAPIAGGVYFISDDRPTTPHDFFMRQLDAAGYQPRVLPVSPQVAMGAARLAEGAYRLLNLEKEPPLTRFLVQQYTTPRWFDIRAARRDLGYAPTISLEEGMARLRAHLAQHPL